MNADEENADLVGDLDPEATLPPQPAPVAPFPAPNTGKPALTGEPE